MRTTFDISPAGGTRKPRRPVFFRDKEQSCFFNQAERAQLVSRTVFSASPILSAWCSFENPYARGGGLGAVTSRILPHLHALKGGAVLVTPWYPAMMAARGAFGTTQIFRSHIQSPLASGSTGFSVFLETHSDGYPILFIRFDDPQLFEASPTPYAYERSRIAYRLRVDSLAFCQAVPMAVRAFARMAGNPQTMFHLQDWQTALIPLTLKDFLLSDTSGWTARSGLTLHNTYDMHYTDAELACLGRRPLNHSCLSTVQERQSHETGITALSVGIMLSDIPPSSVSERFAAEITTDPLQTAIFANHLQALLRTHPPCGIPNGRFTNSADEGLRELSGPNGRPDLSLPNIARYKQNWSQIMRDGIQAFGSATGRPVLDTKGKIVFGMNGRVDLQKGWEIWLSAVKKISSDSKYSAMASDCVFIFMPHSPDPADIAIFTKAVANHPSASCAMVLAHTSLTLYQSIQKGLDFAVMPSIYEPFGAVIEFAVNLTVPIVRETGGLADQVKDGQNGITFREAPPNLADLRRYIEDPGSSPNSWADSMTDGLVAALERAWLIRSKESDRYLAMAAEGARMQERFLWEESVTRYEQWYRSSLGGCRES